VRANFQLTSGDFNNYTLILRADKPYALGEGWQLALRVDAPFVDNNVPSLDNPSVEYRAGFGNLLVQGLLIKAIDQRQAFGFGAQVIAPTASQDQFGSKNVQIVPTLGYSYSLPEIMSLSKVFDVGTRENRSRYMMFPDLFSSVI